MNMDKKAKRLIIGAGIIAFVFGVIFSVHAGTVIGTDIGEFIYNIKH